MPKLSIFKAIPISVAIFAIPAAHAGDFYLGLGVGQSKYDVDMSAGELASETADALVSAGFGPATASASIDKTDTGWKLYGGWQPHKNFALELGYVDLGKAKFGVSGTANLPPVSQYALSGSFKTKSLGLSALGILPLTNNFSGFAKLGFHRWDADLKVAASIPALALTLNESFSDDGTDFTFGLGVKYDITKNLAVRGEWERFKLGGEIDSEVDLLSIGMQFKF